VQCAEVGAVDAHRLLPALVAQHLRAVHVLRQHAGAQQLVARGRALRAGLVVGVHLELGALADQPVGGQRVEVAAAVGMVDVGVAVVPGGIEAHADARREPVAHVHRGVARAFGVGTQGDIAYLGRALAHVVDDAARGDYAGGQPGLALEDFHLLHVLQRQPLFAGDTQAVEAVAGGGVQREAADGDVLVVAHRRVAVAQRGVVVGQFGQRTHHAAVKQPAVQHADRGRGVLPVTTAEAVGLGVPGAGLLGLHAHGIELGGRAVGRGVQGTGVQRQGRGQRGGQQRKGMAAVHSFRHQP